MQLYEVWRRLEKTVRGCLRGEREEVFIIQAGVRQSYASFIWLFIIYTDGSVKEINGKFIDKGTELKISRVKCS